MYSDVMHSDVMDCVVVSLRNGRFFDREENLWKSLLEIV